MIRGALVALGLAGLAVSAHADEIARGSIVKVDHEDIYVNLGSTQGVGAGAALRIKRTIRLKHPISRAQLEDWIPIGSATITQPGNGLSRAVIGKLIDEVRVGDVVEVLVSSDAPPPRPIDPPRPSPAEPQQPVEPATAAVLAVFAAQSGLPIDARIASWERYLSTNRGSPFAAAIQQDVATLELLREQLKPPTLDGEDDEVAEQLEHAAPTAADAGAAVPVVFVLSHPDHVASAYLHYRTRDQRTYTRILLAREHDIYLRGAVPAAVVRAPGVDYFVEVTTPGGRSGLALGSPGQPIHVSVAKPPIADRFEENVGRSSVVITGEYLDFATFDKRDGDRRDRLIDASVDVGYRLDAIVQRVGVGYGAIVGEGGYTDFTYDDAGSPIPKRGYHYGYADVEAGKPNLVLGGKLIAGVGKAGFGMGVEGRGRIGAPDGTNLTVVGRNIPEVGWVADVRFGAQPVANWLLGIIVGATDQPSRGDTAAKLATELIWIGSRHVNVLVRGSWQGRSSIHGGVGGAAALGFSW